MAKEERQAPGTIRFCERVPLSKEQAEDLDTARLVTRIQSNGQESVSELYSRYFDRVYAYLRVALRDQHEAEDSAQQVFLDVLEALPRYELRGKPFRAWLFTIVRNQARTSLEKQGRFDLEEPIAINRRRDAAVAGRDGESVEGVLSWISDRDLLVLVERLPVAQRQVLMLRFLLDLSHSQVAEILGRNEEDVRVLQHRALRFLEERLSAAPRLETGRPRARVRGALRQAPVLRERRFALSRGF